MQQEKFWKQETKQKEMFLNDLETYIPQIEIELKKILKEKINFELTNGIKTEEFLREDLAFDLENLKQAENSKFLEFENLDENEILEKLKNKSLDDLIDLQIDVSLTKKILAEIEFLKLCNQKVNSNIQEVYFDLDETLVSHVNNYNKPRQSIDFIRPAARIILEKLKEKGIKIGILTTREKKYIPQEIKKFVNAKIIDRNSGIEYKEKCFQKYGSEKTPYDDKACFAKLAKPNLMIVDDAPYAKEYKNCVFVSDEAKFLL